LSPLELLRFARTCRAARTTVQVYLNARHGVNARLARFFDNPIAFRSLQARTGTVISGAHALHFFTGTPCFLSASLDIYVYPFHAPEIGRWLTEHDYEFVPDPGQDAEFEEVLLSDTIYTSVFHSDQYIAGQYTFARAASVDTPSIRMAVAEKTPMEAILGAPATSCLNFLTYEKAYCLYPRATLHERRTLLLDSSGGETTQSNHFNTCTGSQLNILTELQGEESASSSPHASFPMGWRWVTDSSTYIVSL
ncbi:hypothetical protein BV20DRAFT_903328, partial [Pilatotrama ljubarskyi]